MFWGGCMGNPTYDRQYFEGFVRELNALTKKWGVVFSEEGGSLSATYEVLPDDGYRDGAALVRMNLHGTYRVTDWEK